MKKAFAGLLVGACIGSAVAAPADDRWYVSVMANYLVGEQTDGAISRTLPASDSDGYSGDLGVRIGVGKPISDSWDLEARLALININQTADIELEQIEVGVEALYFITRNRAFAPYVFAGAGYETTDISTGNSVEGPVADIGVGFLSRIHESGLAARADIRYRVDWSNNVIDNGDDHNFTEYGEWFVDLGLQYGFGSAKDDEGNQLYGFDENTWYVSPMVYYVLADDERPTGNSNTAYGDSSGFGLGVGIGREVSESINIEGRLFGYQISTDDGAPVDEINQLGVGLDVQYFFTRNPGFAPYLATGLSIINNDFSETEDDITYPTIEFGGGFLTDITRGGTAIRGDLRYRLDPQDRHNANGVTEFNDIIAGVGVYVPFGSKSAAAPIVVPPTPVDTDNDGVLDSKDGCPSTPAGAEVDALGCELDGDNDGVVNSKDKCKDSPAGVKVDAEGCKIVEKIIPAVIDSDNDGVNDPQDVCPNTRAGLKVDTFGCELPELVTVNFAFDSAQLDRVSRQKLDVVARTMNKRSYIIAIATGHADAIGSAQYNLSLSKRRALAVKRYLISRSVPANNVVTKWAGESQPVADNATAAGRAANRRVEVVLRQK